MPSYPKGKARAEVRHAQVEFESSYVGKSRLESTASIAATLGSIMKV